MADAEHEYLVETERLRAELERVRDIAFRAVALAQDSQDRADGQHDPWLDAAQADLAAV